MTEMLDGRIPDNFNPDDLGTYMDNIDDMGVNELEEQLPQAQEAIESIESKRVEARGANESKGCGLGMRGCYVRPPCSPEASWKPSEIRGWILDPAVPRSYRGRSLQEEQPN